jgi:Flp pilus assembly pilin Flp
MSARASIYTFLKDETGAVTVDWVVITAAIVGMSLIIVALFSDALFGATGVFTTSLQGAMIDAAAVN